MNTRTKGIVVYLLIAFGLAWANWEIVLRSGIAIDNPLFKFLSMPSAFAPAIGCFLVRKWVTREGFGDAGLRPNLSKWPYYLVAWLLPVMGIALIVVLTPLLGLGTADFTLARGIRYLTPAGMPVKVATHPFLGILLTASPITSILAAPILFGEEFGWRGYLQLRLFPGRPLASAAGTGLIWAAWHLPVNLRGYNFPERPILGALVVFPVSCILLSIIFGWLVARTGSIWSSSFAHAATNCIAGSLGALLLAGGGNFLFISYLGLLGWIPLGALSAWIVFTGQLHPAESLPGGSELGRAVHADR
jgi:uncharacterized protein